MDELSALLRNNQVGLAQQIEVIGNTGQAHDKVPANFAHGQLPLPQQFQDAAAGRVVEGAEKLRACIQNRVRSRCGPILGCGEARGGSIPAGL